MALFLWAVLALASLRTVRADDNVQELRLVAGNKQIKDEDAFVFVILGDGFTESQQELFFEKAEETAAYMLNTTPYRENRQLFKFYALGCVSEESGARGDGAASRQEELLDRRDTFFHSCYWTDGVQRLLSIDETEEKRALLIASQYVPDMDYAILLVNAETYGGSGGSVCVASLHASSVEIVLHELGHTIAGLGDEYWPGAEQMAETPNTTQQSDASLVPWAGLVGQEGIGVYPYEDGEDGWCKPSQNCKMQYLGEEYAFCAVCRQALEQAFLAHSSAEAVKAAKYRPYILSAAFCAVLLAGVSAAFAVKKRKRKKNG